MTRVAALRLAATLARRGFVVSARLVVAAVPPGVVVIEVNETVPRAELRS